MDASRLLRESASLSLVPFKRMVKEVVKTEQNVAIKEPKNVLYTYTRGI